MSVKLFTPSQSLADINKQILEIKKKIQLSEGQRKAVFEEYETERKSNLEKVQKLKKEISELKKSFQENKDESASNRIGILRLESIIGPLSNKTIEQVKHVLDLHIIDQTKHLDIIRHKVKQREQHLSELAKKYREVLRDKTEKEVAVKVDTPFIKVRKIKENLNRRLPRTISMLAWFPGWNNTNVSMRLLVRDFIWAASWNEHNCCVRFTKQMAIAKASQSEENFSETNNKMAIAKASQSEENFSETNNKKTCTLQNNIHRIEIQWREGEHVRRSYRHIRASLLNDRAKFESILERLEEQLESQQRDIKQLQKVCVEAAKTRTAVRNTLEKEERTAMNSGKIREKQNTDYKNLVAERKMELERLERKIFQSGKVAPPKPDAGDETEQTDETTPEEDQEIALKESFSKLKDVTGATTTKEVLIRFEAQGETKSRLDYLKKTTEQEKRQLELKQAKLISVLERFKYAQEKDKEKNNEQVVSLKEEIETTKKRIGTLQEKTKKIQSLLESICKSLYTLYISVKDNTVSVTVEISDKLEFSNLLISTLWEEIQKLLERSKVDLKEEVEDEKTEEPVVSDEDMLMPPSYSALLRRTPLPFQGQAQHVSVPSVTVSEDEEEVPSRGFLKRQAQLVADAKSRRKVLRVPAPRK